jgi:hypothetical protein
VLDHEARLTEEDDELGGDVHALPPDKGALALGARPREQFGLDHRLEVESTRGKILRRQLTEPAHRTERGEHDAAAGLQGGVDRTQDARVVVDRVVLSAKEREGPLAETDGGVERLSLVAQVDGVDATPLHRRLDSRRRRGAGGLVEHAPRDVDSGDPVAAARELDGVPAGAAADVEDARARRQGELARDEVDLAQRAGDEHLVHVLGGVAVAEVAPLVHGRDCCPRFEIGPL